LRHGGKHERPSGEDAHDEFEAREDEQQRDRNVPAAGGRVEQTDLKRAGAGHEIADRLREAGKRGRDTWIRSSRHHEEDGQPQAGPLADAKYEHPERCLVNRRPERSGQAGGGSDQAGHDEGALAAGPVRDHRDDQ
jgi:hypothetical protein